MDDEMKRIEEPSGRMTAVQAAEAARRTAEAAIETAENAQREVLLAGEDAKSVQDAVLETPEALAGAPTTPDAAGLVSENDIDKAVGVSLVGKASTESPAKGGNNHAFREHAARNTAIALFALVLVALGLFVAAYLGLFKLPAPLQDRVDLLPDVNARTGALNADDEEAAPGSYRLVLNQSPTMDEGSTTCPIQFENASGNTYNSRLVLVLDETGEELGSTHRVFPNSYVEDIALSRELPAGEHAATAKVTVYAGATEINQISAQVNIRVM